MDEEVLISFAIESRSRSRYRSFLSNPKKRSKLLDKLNHQPALDSRYTTWFASFTKAVDSISAPLDETVFVLSAAHEIDAKSMTLREAIEEVPAQGWGTLIGISPSLALYYGEGGERAAVICK